MAPPMHSTGCTSQAPVALLVHSRGHVWGEDACSSRILRSSSSSLVLVLVIVLVLVFVLVLVLVLVLVMVLVPIERKIGRCVSLCL